MYYKLVTLIIDHVVLLDCNEECEKALLKLFLTKPICNLP